MECKYKEEIIKKFYSDKNDIFFISHTSQCCQCKSTIDIIKSFDRIKFINEPSFFLDRNILLYASRNISSRLSLYVIKRIYLTFVFSVALFLFVFLPIKYGYDWEEFDYRIKEFETEFSNVYNFSSYEYIYYDFLDIY